MMVIMMMILKLLLVTQDCAMSAGAKVCTSLRNYALVLKNKDREFAVQFEKLDENDMKSMKLYYN
jgi:hypothetical protein